METVIELLKSAKGEITAGLVLALLGWLYGRYRAFVKMYSLKKKELERMEREMFKFGNTKKEIERLQEALRESASQCEDLQHELKRKDEAIGQAREELQRKDEALSQYEAKYQEASQRITELESQLEALQAELQHKDEALRQNADTAAQSSQSNEFDILFDKFNVEDFEQYSKRLVATRKAMRCDEGVKVRARRWTLGILKDTGIHAVDMLVWSAQFELAAKTTSNDLDNFTPTALSAFKDVVTETLMAVGVYLVKQGKLTRNKLSDAFNCGITKLREVVNAALPTGSDYEIFSHNREAFNRTTEIINKLERQGLTSLESQLDASQQELEREKAKKRLPPMSDSDFLELCMSGEAQKVEEAIMNGAYVNTRDNHGMTALMLAAQYDHEGVAEVLLKYGADVNAKNAFGQTALIRAALCGYAGFAEVLLKHGADVNAKDDDGETALMAAMRFGKKETADLLRSYGATD